MPKPEMSFKVGAVRAAIFRNAIQSNGQTINIGKVVLEVRYRDKNGEWKSAKSMSANEVPKAILALQKAYEYLTCHKEAGSQDPQGQDQGYGDGQNTPDTPQVPTERISEA